jgi:2-amino-4-hydroxy-6-hydroxymethyldihydropteridine diphosphokinase
MPKVWLSLGSNLERESHIAGVVRELRRRFGEMVISTVYESTAVGFEGAPFYNLVVGFDTGWTVDELIRMFREIESRHGRLRSERKFSPRSLDIDLLTYGDRIADDGEGYQLPRDEILRYAFVLRPLAEVAGEELHPILGKSYRDLWEAFDDPGQQLHPVDFIFS